MSVNVIEVRELAGRSFGESEDGSRKYDRKYLVRLDTSAATPGEADAIEGYVEAALPFSRYDPHPACPYVYCRAIQCEQVVGPVRAAAGETQWTVTATYSSQQRRAGSSTAAIPTGTGGERPKPDNKQDQSTEASDRLPSIKFVRKERKTVLEQQVGGGAVLNSAGDPFDPPVEVDRSYFQIDITFWRYPEDVDLSDLLGYCDKVNSDVLTFLGVTFGTDTLKVVDISPEMVWDKGKSTDGTTPITTLFFQIRVVLEYNPDTWTITVLDAGKRELKGGNLVPITDPRTGQPVNDPAPLKASGAACGPGDAKHYLDFAGYEAAALAGIFA